MQWSVIMPAIRENLIAATLTMIRQIAAAAFLAATAFLLLAPWLLTEVVGTEFTNWGLVYDSCLVFPRVPSFAPEPERSTGER
jgi:hypothetical protein